MAAWARKIAKDPNATTPADIQALRDAGLDDGQVFAITGPERRLNRRVSGYR